MRYLLLLFVPTLFAADEKKTPLAPTAHHRVVTRDGIELATDVYLPIGQAGPFPVVLIRTPYGRSGARGFVDRLFAAGMGVVAQDVRGRGDSQGSPALVFNDGGLGVSLDGSSLGAVADGHDTVAWIAKQPWCDGNIGTFGGSAVGITQNMLAPGAHPALKAQFVEVAFADMYAQCGFQGGAWRKMLLEGWLSANRIADVNQVTFQAHPHRDDFWSQFDAPAQAHRVTAAGLYLGGWYDIFLQGTIDSFVSVHHRGSPPARGNCRLIIGPWAHGTFNELKYPKNSERPPAADPIRWFTRNLRSDQKSSQFPAVHYYVMGDPTDPNAPGNEWRTADDWPPASTPTNWYLQPDGGLRTQQPETAAQLCYRYDPRNPVPTVGGQNLILPKGPMDQRKVESRPDMLVFTSAPLEQPLEVTGRIRATLYVSSDCPDTDFVVKLCDVYPDTSAEAAESQDSRPAGRSMLVTDGILRACHWRSDDREDLLQRGKIYRLTVDLWSTSLIFQRGHRIRVAVSSSNFPRFAANPNTGRLFEPATRIATNTLHLAPGYPSHIELPIVAEKDARSAAEPVAVSER